MNHYQKLATVLVRCVGGLSATLGALGLLYGAALRAQGVPFSPDQAERFGASFWYIVVGIVVFLLARPIGRLLGRGLE